MRTKIVLETGIPFDVVDNMALTDILDIQAVWSAESKVTEAKQNSARNKTGRKK